MTDGRSAHARIYDKRWHRARLAYLRRHPLCVDCERRNRIIVATVVDHITPHKGDTRLFWDPANWQALCKPCHDGAKQSLDRTGRMRGCDEQGRPLDPAHPWRSP